MNILGWYTVFYNSGQNGIQVYGAIDPTTKFPINLLGKAWKGLVVCITGEYTDPDGKKWAKIIWEGTEAYLPKTCTSLGFKIVAGTLVKSYIPADVGYLEPDVNPDLSPYGDPTTNTYAVVSVKAINVRAGAPDASGNLNPTILGQLLKGAVIEITGGSSGTEDTKWTRINFKDASGNPTKGWIKNMVTDYDGAKEYPGDIVPSFIVSDVRNLLTYTGTAVEVPPEEEPEDPQPPVTQLSFAAQATNLENEVKALRILVDKLVAKYPV